MYLKWIVLLKWMSINITIFKLGFCYYLNFVRVYFYPNLSWVFEKKLKLVSFSETENKQVTDFICIPVVYKFGKLITEKSYLLFKSFSIMTIFCTTIQVFRYWDGSLIFVYFFCLPVPSPSLKPAPFLQTIGGFALPLSLDTVV